ACGAGLAGGGTGGELVPRPGARRGVRPAEGARGRGLVLGRGDGLLVEQQRHEEILLELRRRRLIEPVGLAGKVDRLVELEPPAAEVEDARPDADPAGALAAAGQVAVVGRAGRTDHVDGLESQRLARDRRGLVGVRLERHAALLGDDRAVLSGRIVADPGSVGGHVSPPSVDGWRSRRPPASSRSASQSASIHTGYTPSGAYSSNLMASPRLMSAMRSPQNAPISVPSCAPPRIVSPGCGAM